VYAPTLTGLAERTHLASPDVGLTIHVQDVASVVEFDDLRDVILVGTSSGGTVVTGVAGRISDRIASLVYLDAFVPSDGESTVDLMPPDRREELEKFVEAEGEGWLLPRFAPLPWRVILRGDVWRVTDERDVEWMLPRLRPTPFRHFTEPVRLESDRVEGIERTYIRCSARPPRAQFDNAAARVRGIPGWRYLEIDTPHIPYVTHSQVVTDALAQIAASR
jgi:pimeloyl-ACP methyl ester carboxylesterase